MNTDEGKEKMEIKEKQFQFKSQPLLGSSKMWLMHIQYGHRGNKNKDYTSCELLIEDTFYRNINRYVDNHSMSLRKSADPTVVYLSVDVLAAGASGAGILWEHFFENFSGMSFDYFLQKLDNEEDINFFKEDKQKELMDNIREEQQQIISEVMKDHLSEDFLKDVNLDDSTKH